MSAADFELFLKSSGQVDAKATPEPAPAPAVTQAVGVEQTFTQILTDTATTQEETKQKGGDDDDAVLEPRTRPTGAKAKVPMQMLPFHQMFNMGRMQQSEFKSGKGESKGSGSGSRSQRGTSADSRTVGLPRGEGSSGRKVSLGAAVPFRDMRVLPLPFELDSQQDISRVREFMRMIAGATNLDESQVWTDYDEEERQRQAREDMMTGDDEQDYLNKVKNARESTRPGVVKKGGIYIFPSILYALRQAVSDVQAWTSTGQETSMQFLIKDDDLWIPFSSLVAAKLAQRNYMQPHQYYTGSYQPTIVGERERILDRMRQIMVKKGRSVDPAEEGTIYYQHGAPPAWAADLF